MSLLRFRHLEGVTDVDEKYSRMVIGALFMTARKKSVAIALIK